MAAIHFMASIAIVFVHPPREEEESDCKAKVADVEIAVVAKEE